MVTLDELLHDTEFCLTDGNKMADAIREEIDKYYIPRPLFEDGEPVHTDDYIETDEGIDRVQWYDVNEYGYVYMNGYREEPDYFFEPGERIKRPREDDEQSATMIKFPEVIPFTIDSTSPSKDNRETQALKILEEAAELLEAAKSRAESNIIYEAMDVYQALGNFISLYDWTDEDIESTYRAVYEHNKERGRYATEVNE